MLSVVRDGIESNLRQIYISRFSPGLFTFQSGIGPAVAANLDGSFAQSAGFLPGIAARPAEIGEVITIYATGLGDVNVPISNGASSVDQLRETVIAPTVLIGGLPGRLLFSGLSSQYPASINSM